MKRGPSPHPLSLPLSLRDALETPGIPAPGRLSFPTFVVTTDQSSFSPQGLSLEQDLASTHPFRTSGCLQDMRSTPGLPSLATVTFGAGLFSLEGGLVCAPEDAEQHLGPPLTRTAVRTPAPCHIGLLDLAACFPQSNGPKSHSAF